MPKTKEPAGPLDQALMNYLKALRGEAGLAEELGARGGLADEMAKAALASRGYWQNPKVTIDLNATAMVMRFSETALEAELSDSRMHLPELDDLIDALRRRMPDTAWPISIEVEFSGLDERDRSSYFCTPQCRGLAYAGIQVDGSQYRIPENHEVFYALGGGYRDYGMGGLDGIADAMDLVQNTLRPTNRPVMAWQQAHDIGGSGHVQHQRYYARTEAEVVLKRIVARRGPSALAAMIDAGKLERGRNDARMWFVAVDVGDLDRNPLGTVLRAPDILDDIDDMLALNAAAPKP